MLAVTSSVTTNGYQIERLPGEVSTVGFHGIAEFFTGNRVHCENNPMNDLRQAPRRLRKPNPMNDVSQPVNEAKSGPNGPIVETPHE